MAIFKHGKTWWFEYRTRKPKVRVVKNTGFLIASPDGQKKAAEAFAAFKMGIGLKPKRSALEGIMDAIYDGHGAEAHGVPLCTVWPIYEDWFKGKGKIVAASTWNNYRNEIARLVEWCEKKSAADANDISVGLAREYVRFVTDNPEGEEPRSNKTVRNIINGISGVWDAVGQIHPEVHNPWKAACPVNDGSSMRRPEFTKDEETAAMKAAKELGHDWYPISMTALYTGIRYGDIATLQIGDADTAMKTQVLETGIVDLKKWLIVVDPSKTKRSSGVRVVIPIAAPLQEVLGEYVQTVGFLFPEHAIAYETKRKIAVWYSEVLERAGVVGRGHTFHSWRHTANTRMAEAGVTSEVREMIFGWTDGKMAKHYDHAKHLKELADAVSKIA